MVSSRQVITSVVDEMALDEDVDLSKVIDLAEKKLVFRSKQRIPNRRI